MCIKRQSSGSQISRWCLIVVWCPRVARKQKKGLSRICLGHISPWNQRENMRNYIFKPYNNIYVYLFIIFKKKSIFRTITFFLLCLFFIINYGHDNQIMHILPWDIKSVYLWKFHWWNMMRGIVSVIYYVSRSSWSDTEARHQGGNGQQGDSQSWGRGSQRFHSHANGKGYVFCEYL